MKQRKMFNCPNCAAPINTEKCPYCGTMILDFSCIDEKEINYIKIKTRGKVYMVRAFLGEQELKITPNFDVIRGSFERPLVLRQLGPDMELSLHFYVVPDENGVMYREVRTDGE